MVSPRYVAFFASFIFIILAFIDSSHMQLQFNHRSQLSACMSFLYFFTESLKNSPSSRPISCHEVVRTFSPFLEASSPLTSTPLHPTHVIQLDHTFFPLFLVPCVHSIVKSLLLNIIKINTPQLAKLYHIAITIELIFAKTNLGRNSMNTTSLLSVLISDNPR